MILTIFFLNEQGKFVENYHSNEREEEETTTRPDILHFFGQGNLLLSGKSQGNSGLVLLFIQQVHVDSMFPCICSIINKNVNDVIYASVRTPIDHKYVRTNQNARIIQHSIILLLIVGFIL